MSEEKSETLKGTVKWFNDAKGFGFIEHPSGKDVFVHYSAIEADGFKTLKDGEEVQYEIKEGPKGLHAARVVRTNPPPAEADGADDASSDDDSSAQTTIIETGSLDSQVQHIADSAVAADQNALIAQSSGVHSQTDGSSTDLH